MRFWVCPLRVRPRTLKFTDKTPRVCDQDDAQLEAPGRISRSQMPATAKFRLLTVIAPSSTLITISDGEWPLREVGSIKLFGIRG